MKLRTKIFLAIAAIGAAAAYYFLTPTPVINIQKAKTEININASHIYANYFEDEAAANEKYAGKVVEVSGTLLSVDQLENGDYQLALDADNPLGRIICTLQVIAPDLQNLEMGQDITIKGVCTGYLFDVVIDHAMIV